MHGPQHSVVRVSKFTLDVVGNTDRNDGIGCIAEDSQSHTTDSGHAGLQVSDRHILQNGNDFTKNQSKQQGGGDQH